MPTHYRRAGSVPPSIASARGTGRGVGTAEADERRVFAVCGLTTVLVVIRLHALLDDFARFLVTAAA